jgi:hypothetical protein
MAFTFKLELPDGTEATPPTLTASVPDRKPGDVVHVGRDRLRVLERSRGAPLR